MALEKTSGKSGVGAQHDEVSRDGGEVSEGVPSLAPGHRYLCRRREKGMSHWSPQLEIDYIANTRFKYSMLFVAMTSAPSSNLNTSTDTVPS